MSNLKTINDIQDLKGKKVVVRADLNVPTEGTKITDNSRIERFAPTAKLLSDKGAKVIIITHFGRPKGKKSPEFSTKILVDNLSSAIGKPVEFVDDTIGDTVTAKINEMKDGDIILLENVRFYNEEEANDSEFSKKLASLGELYVNDAFSTSHRAHASTEGITKYLPSYAGLLMEEEVNALTSALENPKHPAIAIVGGSKVSTKLAVLENITKKVDAIVIGGAMANTFLLAQGYNIGSSMAEEDMKDTALKIIEEAKKNGCEIILPVDVCVAKEFKANAENKFVGIDDVDGDWKIFDIGPESSKILNEKFAEAKTVLWNGPLGVFELVPFDRGTNELAKTVAKLTRDGKIISVAGGGDTVSALNNAGVAKDFTYISTAGGAFLEWLEGKTLPAIPPLMK
ncbi:MAG: phosphoglycerate kinase [Alphaproteobacteria bacterium]